MAVSCDLDEGFDVYAESFPKARKSHKCTECDKEIEIGEVYASCRGLYDGAFQTYPQHVKCYHLCRAANGVYGYCTIPFCALSLWAFDRDHWGDPAWLMYAAALAEIFGDSWRRAFLDTYEDGSEHEGDHHPDWIVARKSLDAPVDWAQIEADSLAYCPSGVIVKVTLGRAA